MKKAIAELMFLDSFAVVIYMSVRGLSLRIFENL